MKNYEEFRIKTYLNISLVLLAVFTVINISHNIQHFLFIHEISPGIITFNILNVFVAISCFIVKKEKTETGINLLLVALSFTMIAINLYIRQFYYHNNIIVVFPVLLAIFLASKKAALAIAAFNILAIADVYDALISDRPYKKRMSHEEAIAVIKAGSGTQFDPDVVKCFHHVQKEIYRETHKLL